MLLLYSSMLTDESCDFVFVRRLLINVVDDIVWLCGCVCVFVGYQWETSEWG